MEPNDKLMAMVRAADAAAMRVALGGLVGQIDVLIVGPAVYSQMETAEVIRDRLIQTLAEEIGRVGGAK